MLCKDIKIKNDRLFVHGNVFGNYKLVDCVFYPSDIDVTSSLASPVAASHPMSPSTGAKSENSATALCACPPNPDHSNLLSSSISVCLFNSRSLVHKLSKFQSFVYSNPFDIYCITETWLSDVIFDNEILALGYNIFRKDRGSRGGGVLLAVADSISTQLLPSPPNLEVLSIKICNRTQPIILCCVYNPPISEIQYFNSLISYFTTLANTDDSFVLLGDFNLPDTSWSSLSGASINSNFFCDFVFQYNLFQMIESPTHIQGNVLDLILTNDLELVTDLVILPHQSQVISSDHLMITFSISSYSQPSFCNPPIDFPKANFSGLCDYLLSCDFSMCFESNDIEFVWSSLKFTILYGMKLFIPKVRLRSHQRPKWVTSNIQHDLNRFRTLKRKCKLHSTLQNLSRLYSTESMLREKLKQAKYTYETTLVLDFASSCNHVLRLLFSQL